MGAEKECSLVIELWTPSQGQCGPGGLCQLRPAQMKAVERALDVHVGEWEYFEGEARTPRRGQGLKEMEMGRADLLGPGERGAGYFPPFRLLLPLPGLLAPASGSRMGISWASSLAGTGCPVSEPGS